MKRLFDFIISTLGIIISLPLWLLLSLLVWLEDGGPVFYLQERTGLGGKIFRCIKFRSMVVGAENECGPIQEDANDSRVTKIGTIMRDTALDELPQLINIAKGDMSFVGPRALRTEEKDVGSVEVKSIFEFPAFLERSKIRPGLTGIGQIVLPHTIPREIRFKYDIWYIKNQNFWLDIYLIFVSFLITFMGKWDARAEKISFLKANLACKINENVREM